MNDQLAADIGERPDDLVGHDIFGFVEEEQRPGGRQALRRAARTGKLVATAWKLRGRSVGELELVLSPQPLQGDRGQRLYVVTTRAMAPLLAPPERHDMMGAIVSECDEAIVSTDLSGLIEIWNHAAEELFGWTEKESVRAAADMVVPHERQEEARDLMARAQAGEVINRVETLRVCKGGSRVEVSISLAPLRDLRGQVIGVCQVVRDISRQKASERALAYQAMHDHLTGLPNRSLLEDRISHALERCRREGHMVGVLFFDIDHFKNVNDTAGHEMGDNLLRAVAARLRQSVRAVDTVARLGGDEFVVLCEDITSDDQLDIIVSHIMTKFCEPVALPDGQWWVTVSAGMVTGDASSSVAQLLSRADAAMYQAKARSRGSAVHYDPATHPELERKTEGSRLLRLALEAHQFVPYYQPIVELHTGRTVCVEALARWEHPVRGVVAAKDFIPLAEEMGLIREISEIILAEAGLQVNEWARTVPGLRVSVNVSPLQLRGTALLTNVRALLDEGIKPASMVLEMTESSLMEDAETSRSVLLELRQAGFGIAIDDFGTGYSSLAYLKQLPATIIKVDQAFTAQLPDPHDLSIVMAILAIADTYGLEVVAEGIETEQQAEVLKSLGCQHGQGYYYGRPVPAAELTRQLGAAQAQAPTQRTSPQE